MAGTREDILLAEVLTSWRTLSHLLKENLAGEGNDWQEKTMSRENEGHSHQNK